MKEPWRAVSKPAPTEPAHILSLKLCLSLDESYCLSSGSRIRSGMERRKCLPRVSLRFIVFTGLQPPVPALPSNKETRPNTNSFIRRGKSLLISLWQREKCANLLTPYSKLLILKPEFKPDIAPDAIGSLNMLAFKDQ
jgi:hypothetical protein